MQRLICDWIQQQLRRGTTIKEINFESQPVPGLALDSVSSNYRIIEGFEFEGTLKVI